MNHSSISQKQAPNGTEFLEMKEMHLLNQRTNRQLMKENKQKLTLDRPATYQIKVPGHLDERWAEWAGEMTFTVEGDNDGLPVSTLIGTFDQAALLGLLRRLYSLGLPLISVICVEGN